MCSTFHIVSCHFGSCFGVLVFMIADPSSQCWAVWKRQNHTWLIFLLSRSRPRICFCTAAAMSVLFFISWLMASALIAQHVGGAHTHRKINMHAEQKIKYKPLKNMLDVSVLRRQCWVQHSRGQIDPKILKWASCDIPVTYQFDF